MRWPYPVAGQRKKRIRFALFPTNIGGLVVWLEFYYSIYEWTKFPEYRFCYWEHVGKYIGTLEPQGVEKND